jgi:hypothetical protein
MPNWGDINWFQVIALVVIAWGVYYYEVRLSKLGYKLNNLCNLLTEKFDIEI